MVGQTILKGVPAGIFTWLTRQSQRTERQHKLALRRAQARAFAAFAEQHPAWAASLFDEHFLDHAAAPLLQRYLLPEGAPTAIELGAAYYAQLSNTGYEPRGFAEAITAASRFLALLDHELGSFRTARPSEQIGQRDARPVLPPPPYAGEAEEVFADALRDAPNLEMDWIWLACRVARETERRYCLERALYINPNSATARRMLANGATG
jgi:hypothetical protein